MKKITPQELKKKLESDEVLLIDVREPAEHLSEFIPGSQSIPLSEFEKKKLEPGSKTIVIHCNSGRRSDDACKKLLSLNPEMDVYSLEGGITAWRKAGYEVKTTSGCKIIALDRQTQIAAGSLSLLGIILGFALNSWFFGISAFVSVGLIFAGVSGWCGMARLLAKMSWNYAL